ncbi:hypothetical protein G7Y79_00004g013930 [Physcia stellaris]|nr:hypothetical protein G7Y79_00004g013930 [Physcia stellaris]
MTISTLYPKIGKLTDVVRRSKFLEIPSLSLIGTVKLHGTHADMVIEKGDDIRLQSRNRAELDLGTDNCGFAAFAIPLRAQILALKERYIARYRTLHPGTPLNPECPVVIAGEWCGKGIQKKVALIQLPKHFVIVSVHINGSWVPDTDYADIHDEAVGIYNVSKAGFFYHELDIANVEDSEMQIGTLVKKVETQCPYALKLDVSGIGEGIVWKARDFCKDPEFWFKSKGDEFAVKIVDKSEPDLLKLQHAERAQEFAKQVTTVNRMQQGWDFLSEMRIPQDISGTRQFLSWLMGDCLTEEAREIAEAGLDKGQLKSAICLIGKDWYKAKVDLKESRELGNSSS